MHTLTLLIKTPVITDLRNLLKQYDLTFTLMTSVKALFPDKVTFIHTGGAAKSSTYLGRGRHNSTYNSGKRKTCDKKKA